MAWISKFRKRLFYQHAYSGCVWPFDDPCDDWSRHLDKLENLRAGL